MRTKNNSIYGQFSRSTCWATSCYHQLRKNTNPAKSCRTCTKNNVQEESRYFCEKFKDIPTLYADPCFRLYHQQHVENDGANSEDDN